MLKSNILKLALFATGLSGIVAEYMLSTMATYFIGDSVFHWTMIISTMLFSMGFGSRLSKYFDKDLLTVFVSIEFILSLLVSFSSMMVYVSSVYTEYTGIVIYTLAIIIGVLIGMEIPLVMRINAEYEELKENVASVVEKDYYGSLLGGVFYAFIGLPLLGLTFTPFLLGSINLLVAIGLLYYLRPAFVVGSFQTLKVVSFVLVLIIGVGTLYAKPVILFGEQRKYKDQVIHAEQSKYQKIVITQWKNHYWLYLNGNQQLSSLDEVMYHEPLVHPAMQLFPQAKNVLVLGGGDGCAVRELLKYPSVEQIELVDLDPAMTDLGKNHYTLQSINGNSLNHKKVKVFNDDGFNYLEKEAKFYDVIIVDLPDPKTVELGRLYSNEFYRLCKKHLRKNGVLITQAGSPYFATKAFKCIEKTMDSAGFVVAPMHNQILTLGEWGWVLGVKNESLKNHGNGSEKLKAKLRSLDFENVSTEWINNEAMLMMTSFGKSIYPNQENSVLINEIHHPVLYQYYLDGNWGLY